MDLNKKLEELKPYQLNCNVFDVYSYNGLTMQDLLCQFFTKINECITVSNETIDLAKWLVNEGLEIEVVKKLMIWLEDGTLENIINDSIFNDLNTKIQNNINDLSNFKEEVIDNKLKRLRNISEYKNLVKNYGSENEDWSYAINTAIDDLSQGGELFIPGGVYKINNTINFKAGCKIRGVKGLTNLKLIKDNIALFNIKNGEEGCESFNSKIENLTLSGNGKTHNQIGIDLSSWIFEVKDCDINHFNVGVKVDGVIVDIDNCYINNCMKGIEILTLNNGNPSTMINIKRSQIHYNEIGLFTTDFNDPNNKRPIIMLQIEKVAFEYNNMAYHLKGVMNSIIKHCWFEKNEQKPITENYSILFEQNRYEGGSSQMPDISQGGDYSGHTIIDCGGHIYTKNLYLQDYGSGLLEEKRMYINNDVLFISDNVLNTVSKNGIIRSKNYSMTIFKDGLQTLNGEEGLFTVRQITKGHYEIKVKDGYSLNHPIINVQGVNELNSGEVVCVTNCSFSDPGTYRDWFAIDTIEVKSYKYNTNELVDCKLMVNIICDKIHQKK